MDGFLTFACPEHHLGAVRLLGHGQLVDLANLEDPTDRAMLTSSMTMGLFVLLGDVTSLDVASLGVILQIVGGTYLSLTARPSHIYLAREVHFSSLSRD